MSFITISSIITFYLNISLWIWFLLSISSLAHCGAGKTLPLLLIPDPKYPGLSNPVLATAMVFVPIFGALSLLDCFLGREGWYLIDLKQTADANHYFGELPI